MSSILIIDTFKKTDTSCRLTIYIGFVIINKGGNTTYWIGIVVI